MVKVVQCRPVQDCLLDRRRVRRPSVPGNAPQERSCRVCTLCHAIPIREGMVISDLWLVVEWDERNYNFGFLRENES